MSEQLRYSDAELEEFRQIILAKIETATALYEELCASLRNNEGNDIADTSPTFKTLEEGASTLEREANCFKNFICFGFIFSSCHSGAI